MKRKVMILMTGLLLISGSVFAQNDVLIDLSGNIEVGASVAGRLEVQGDDDFNGIKGVTGGTGKAIYGVNDDDLGGHAGYFEGNVEVTGDLNVLGTISGSGGGGDITAVNAGNGLSGGGITGNVTLNADTTFLQQRVTGSCPGQVMVGINQDGTVTCQTDDTGGGGGSVTSVTAGTGLTGNGTTGDVTLDVDNTVYYTQTEVDNMLASRDTAIADLQSQVADLLLKVGDKLDKVNVSGDGNDIYITGANLHVESGSGSTDGAVNGLGNVIIGYNETIGAGSHNLVVGKSHDYASYGGIVAGLRNEISGAYSSVIGGEDNIASGLKIVDIRWKTGT